MLLSELIIIYLAVAAPSGVANFIRQPAGAPRTRLLLHATGAALLWPLTLLSRLLVQKKLRRGEQAATPEALPSRELRIDDARRALLASLYRTGDMAEEVSCADNVAAREAVREALASVERYVGLALAVAEADEDAPHAPREMELCRISGRAGDDLRIAGICHRRRNIARLRAHQADSRLELLHALAELREVFESMLAASATEARAALRPLFAALLEAYARSIELLSLFEDTRAATQVARLLDTVCARLRRIESDTPHAATESPIQQDTTASVAPKDEPCITSTPQTNPQPQLTRTQTIRAHG